MELSPESERAPSPIPTPFQIVPTPLPSPLSLDTPPPLPAPFTIDSTPFPPSSTDALTIDLNNSSEPTQSTTSETSPDGGDARSDPLGRVGSASASTEDVTEATPLATLPVIPHYPGYNPDYTDDPPTYEEVIGGATAAEPDARQNPVPYRQSYGPDDVIYYVRARIDYTADNEDDLTFQKGDLIAVLSGGVGQDKIKGRICRNGRMVSGWFPASYLHDDARRRTAKKSFRNTRTGFCFDEGDDIEVLSRKHIPNKRKGFKQSGEVGWFSSSYATDIDSRYINFFEAPTSPMSTLASIMEGSPIPLSALFDIRTLAQRTSPVRTMQPSAPPPPPSPPPPFVPQPQQHTPPQPRPTPPVPSAPQPSFIASSENISDTDLSVVAYCTAQFDYLGHVGQSAGPFSQELSFVTGERITVVEKCQDADIGWWKGRIGTDRVGYFPQRYVIEEVVPPVAYCIGKFDYMAQRISPMGQELSFMKGERISVIDKERTHDKGWWKGYTQPNRVGYFPWVYVEEEVNSDQSNTRDTSSRSLDSISSGGTSHGTVSSDAGHNTDS